MNLLRFSRDLVSRRKTNRQRARAAAASCKPAVECLEERQLLSVSAVTALSGQTTVYMLQPNGNLSERSDGAGSWTLIDTNVKAISAGLDTQGRPEVYEIWGSSNQLWRYSDYAGWRYFNSGAADIAASVNDTFYETDNVQPSGTRDLWAFSPTHGWSFLQSGQTISAISAGTDNLGRPEVYAILGTTRALWRWSEFTGWSSQLDTNVTYVAASVNNTFFDANPTGYDFSVTLWEHTDSGGWRYLGNDLVSSSYQAGTNSGFQAGTDTLGRPELYKISAWQGTLSRYSDATGWVTLDTYVGEVAAAGNDTFFEWSLADDHLWKGNGSSWTDYGFYKSQQVIY
jgi:hypothetical protein